MNDYVVITYSGQQVSVPKEVADFLEQDRKREQAQEKQDERHLSKSEFETVLSGSECVRRPVENAVRAYLKDPGKKTTLTVGQQVLAMDKLLEDAEVNFRMICDMVRYQNMKEAGMVYSVDEFLQLFHSGRTQNE